MNRECFLKQAWQDEYDAFWQRLSPMEEVPYWQQIRGYNLAAHREFPEVWAIAWDWAITKDGPVVL